MTFKIIWSDFAANELNLIFNFYIQKAGKKTAKNLVLALLKACEKLSANPFIGQEEPWLKNRVIEYRYFLHRHFKVIYSVDSKKTLVLISDVFDTRQNQNKLQRNQ
jgi:plasmid stabilization system protein ParE